MKLKRKYNLSWEEYLQLYNTQEGRCKICQSFISVPGNTTEDRMKSGFVDHNHKTGKIRGILCASCNTGLGQFKDSIVLLEEAREYLKQND